MSTFVADFETTTNPTDCRVWAYAICDVDNVENTIVGNTLEDFMKWCMNKKENHTVFFHNLKFDIQFIFYWLFKNGYRHTTDKNDRATKTFNTVISDKNLYYQCEVIFERKGKKINKVVFQDSLKLIPLQVKEIAKAFKLPISKLRIDYDSHNDLPEGAPLTKEEQDYVVNDVKIVAYAIQYFRKMGLQKMTIGACALEEYKKLISKRCFEKWYPSPDFEYDKSVRNAYKGGFTFLNPEFAGKIVGKGMVFDVNSLYPSRMYEEFLPFGTPIPFSGQYKENKIYPLYIQCLRCSFELKKGKIPTLQIKHGMYFKGNEYLTSSDNREVDLVLTNVDLEMFFEHYDVFNVEYQGGYMYKATQGLFQKYIDKWNGIKVQSTKEKNYGMRTIAKLFLNNLYGKFGTGMVVKSKIPYLDEEGMVQFYDSDEEQKDGVYIPMACFITAYARKLTIDSAQKIEDNFHNGKSKVRFVYADTDSLHIVLNGETEEEFIEKCGLNISPTELGAWKFESKFNKAKFLRQKCYIENSTEDVYNDSPEYEMKITVAGMPENCYPFVTFNNFKIGTSYSGKLQNKRVKGGTVLTELDFTIKEC